MNATKYIFTREVTIPNEDKYHLGEIVKHITDICYKIYNPDIIKTPCADIGCDIIMGTTFNYIPFPNHIEIIVPVKHSSYFFQLKFIIDDVEDEYELDNLKKEYENRVTKWVYEHSKYDDVKQEEVEV